MFGQEPDANGHVWTCAGFAKSRVNAADCIRRTRRRVANMGRVSMSLLDTTDLHLVTQARSSKSNPFLCSNLDLKAPHERDIPIPRWTAEEKLNFPKEFQFYLSHFADSRFVICVCAVTLDRPQVLAL